MAPQLDLPHLVHIFDIEQRYQTMNAPNAVIKTKVARVTDAPRIVYNTGRLRKPSPLPIRPLVPDRFRPPKGQKEVYLYVSATHLYIHPLPSLSRCAPFALRTDTPTQKPQPAPSPPHKKEPQMN